MLPVLPRKDNLELLRKMLRTAFVIVLPSSPALAKITAQTSSTARSVPADGLSPCSNSGWRRNPSARTAACFTSTDPATEATNWEGDAASPAQVQVAVDAARAAFPAWADAPRADRIDVAADGIVITDYKLAGSLGNLRSQASHGFAPQLALVVPGDRLQVERGKYDDAAGAWEKLRGVSEMPPDAKLEAGIQEVDLRIRGKTYPNAAALADELQKVATGARKERLAVYAIAAKAASDGKYAEGVDRIRSEMDKSKDPAVHATGYGMMGELYLAAGKSRDAMWMFLWVETVVNQDRDETFKALCRLADLFEKPGEESPLKNPMADEDQAKKYREKLKRFRAMF